MEEEGEMGRDRGLHQRDRILPSPTDWRSLESTGWPAELDESNGRR